MNLAGDSGVDGVGKMAFGGDHAADCHCSAGGRDLGEVPFVVTDKVNLGRADID